MDPADAVPLDEATPPPRRRQRWRSPRVFVPALALALAGVLAATGGVNALTGGGDDTAATSSATGSGDDNVAVAANTKDGKAVYAIRLKIVQTGKDVVDPTNAAVAVASCTDCTTVAIALEGVLVYGDPAVFAPENLALALNVECTNCQTLASAYQTVVQRSTRVRITGEGRRRIAAIRKDLQSLRNSGLDIFAVQHRVDAAAAQFQQVLLNDCVPVGNSKESIPTSAPDQSEDPIPSVSPDHSSAPASSESPTASPSSSPTASPSSSAGPSPDPVSSSTASAPTPAASSPTASPTASPSASSSPSSSPSSTTAAPSASASATATGG